MLSNPSLLEHLLLQLKEYRPSSIIFLSSDQPCAAIKQWAEKNSCLTTTLNHQQTFPKNLIRHEFAIVYDYLNHLDKNTALQRLGLLRNLYSHRIWVVNNNSECQFNDFIGLGFHRQITFRELSSETDNRLTEHPLELKENNQVTCYGYDLASYNHKRSWNNSKYWANPENWNKYRW